MDAKTFFDATLFWDAREIDLERHAHYIISRVLDFGDEKDLKQLRELYSDARLMEVVRKKRGLLPITKRFWTLYFGLTNREKP